MATLNQNPFQQQAPIPGVKRIIAISSGKGGVGKSTVTSHLAHALSKKFRVGILDADIYGPSQPRMMGALHQKPEITTDQKMIPIVRYGIKIMSIGFLIEEESAVVWRGPMLFKAMDQFFRDVQWGELDYLLVDLPPGTGDVQLSLVQKVPVDGAVVVTTPQNISLADVKKAVDMFQRVNTRILGVVENMAFYHHPQTNEKLEMFPRGELKQYMDAKQLKSLGEISFTPSLGLSSEAGIPLTESYPTAPESIEFNRIADLLSEIVPVA